MPTLLLTGFQPFLSYPNNPSAWLAENAAVPANISVHRRVLEVDFERMATAYPALLEEIRPDFIVNMGLNANAQAIHLEQVARNRRAQPQAEPQPIRPDGASELYTTLDLAPLLERLAHRAIPAQISTDAGSYLCNFVYYHSLEYAHAHGAQALFVHLPFSAEWMAESGGNQPALPLAQMAEALAMLWDE